MSESFTFDVNYTTTFENVESVGFVVQWIELSQRRLLASSKNADFRHYRAPRLPSCIRHRRRRSVYIDLFPLFRIQLTSAQISPNRRK
jgi:hypothetical protein